MKWFKHISDSLDDPFIFELIDQFGGDGYLVFFGTLEVMAREFNVESPGSCDVPVRFLAKKLQLSRQKTVKILNFCDEKGRFSLTWHGQLVELKCPKLRDLCDEWTAKQLRSKSGATPVQEVEEEVETDRVDISIVPTTPATPYTKMVDVYHHTACPPLPKMVMMYPGLALKLDEWWSEYGDIDRWEKFLKHVLKSDHLTGKTKGSWVPSLDWLVTPENLAKILNGKYHGPAEVAPTAPVQDQHSKKYDQWKEEADDDPIERDVQDQIDKITKRKPQETNHGNVTEN